MTHNVFVRDDGGGIYSRPVPENFLNFGAFPYTLTPAAFVRSIVASLVTNSTAVRTSNVVTITATSHGVPNTYNGFSFYYPGSPTLAAGWVSNITVVNADTITFPSVGADFSSESINSAAAYVTATTLPFNIVIPGGILTDTSSGRIVLNTASLNTAATKTVRPFLGGNGFGPAQAGTTFPCAAKEWEFGMLNTTQLTSQICGPNNQGGSSLSSVLTFNPLNNNIITIQHTVSAAQDFVAMITAPRIVISR